MSDFKLTRATETDFPALADIANAAFQNDKHTQLRAQNPIAPYDHRQAMLGALQSWAKREGESVNLIKATRLDDGQPVGWICWGFRNLPPESGPLTPSSSINPAPAKKDKDVESQEGQFKTSEAIKNSTPNPLAELESLTSSSLQSWMEKINAETERSMFIVSIAVHPSFHRHGVGRLLVRHGTKQADQHGVICWVSASDAGSSFFESYGFAEDERLELDLDSWATELQNETGKVAIPPEDDAWGKYNFRYMRREPQQHGEKSVPVV